MELYSKKQSELLTSFVNEVKMGGCQQLMVHILNENKSHNDEAKINALIAKVLLADSIEELVNLIKIQLLD